MEGKESSGSTAGSLNSQTSTPNFEFDLSNYPEFDHATSLAVYSLKFREDSMKKSIEKYIKSIDPLEVVESFLRILESPNFDFILRKKLLYSFCHLHSSTLRDSFKDYLPKQQNFNNNWIIFSSIARLIVCPEKIEIQPLIKAIVDKLANSSEEIKEMLETFQNVFINGEMSFEQTEVYSKAISNLSQYLKTQENIDQSIFKLIKEFSKKVEQINLCYQLLNLIDSYDQSLIEVKNVHKTNFTYQENCILLRSTLYYALLSINNTHLGILDDAPKVVSLIHRISHLSHYVQINEIADLLNEYKACLSKIINNEPRSDEDLFKIILSYISQKEPSTCPYIKEFEDFRTARNIHLNSTKNYTTALAVHISFEKFLCLIAKEPLDPILLSVLDSMHNLWGQIALENKLFNDSTVLINFALSYPAKKVTIIEAVDSVIDSIQEMIDQDLFNTGVVDFFSRIRLMFLVFKSLYYTSSSHLATTAENFFNYFPDIFVVKDILKPPKDSNKDPILAKIVSLGTLAFQTQNLQEIFDDITYSVSSPISSKLDTIARFISKTRQFYSAFIPNGGVSPEKYDFIISPTDDTPKFVSLIESLLPLLSYNPTSSLPLAEKAFALALAVIYDPYAQRTTAEIAYKGVLSNLCYRVPNLSFRFAQAICSSLRKLSARGTVELTVEEIDDFENAYSDIIVLNDNFSPEKLETTLNKVISKAPSMSMYDGLSTFSKALNLFDRVSKTISEVSKLLEIDDKISPYLVQLTVVGTLAQTIALMMQQLTGKPMLDNMNVWPFTSNQTNLIIFNDIGDGSCFSKFADFLRENKEKVPTIQKSVFLEASRSMAQVCSVYTKSYVVNPNLGQQVSSMMAGILKKAIEAEKTGNITDFTTDAFVEQFTLLSLLEKRTVNFAVETAKTDIANFRSMLLEFYAFSTLSDTFMTFWKAMNKLPDIFRPKLDDEIEFKVLPPKPSDDNNSEVTFDFKEKLESLQKILSNHEKFDSIKDDFEFLNEKLCHVNTTTDISEIKNHMQRLQAKINTSKNRLQTQIVAVNNEIQRIQNGQMTITKKDVQNLHQNSDRIEQEINELEDELEKKQTELSNETGLVSELAEECRQMKIELQRAHQSKSDITQSLFEETTKSSTKESGSKNQSIIEYTRQIAAQNMKLRTAIKRERLAKRVPALKPSELNDSSEETQNLQNEKEKLQSEVENLEKSLSKCDEKYIEDACGFKKLEMPNEVTEFLKMAEKLRSGKSDEIQPLEFLTCLDFVEKYAFELSQSRRDMFSFLVGSDGRPQSEDDYDFDGENEEEENQQNQVV
ncbi:hypothetical protein TVAG_419010 [Trichomonas vaginalis G3]|uniref:Uncharacterized protein n=1 Tax=Trichomonas vaginalis (strain ATCC PRA-98 / G3) TaxID=412133 RepID=A2F5H2_TRIV3|nr:cilia- and flagella-associated protein 58-related family [Trichomonas vaginalis G3]EAX99844.1 hypothetical protein TVAG_419010 [Trichomonas vaginalis G3]KAI5547684.1 cilia- and flagella-associated protein 58-related family [Trichomonas vaginalis G3]|eukprot:XP_001312774.1 hypothetical protein [Trichomonas vaginalis G3]